MLDRDDVRVGRIAVSVATTLAGLILGVLVGDFMHSDGRLVTGLVATLCLMTIGLAILVADILHGAASREDKVEELIEKLAQEVGFRVSSQTPQQIKTYRREEEDHVVQALRSARSYIHYLDRQEPGGRRPDAGLDPVKTRWHLEAIEERIAAGVRHVRICQLQPGGNPLPDPSLGMNHDALFKHLMDLVRLRRDGQDVALKTAADTFPYKFLIIDGKTLILQLHAVKGSGSGATKALDCELVIRDPHGQLIMHFQRMWQVMEGSPFTVNFEGP